MWIRNAKETAQVPPIVVVELPLGRGHATSLLQVLIVVESNATRTRILSPEAPVLCSSAWKGATRALQL